MRKELRHIAEELDKGKINFKEVGDKLFVPLPNNFDTLIIEIWNDNGEVSISLQNGEYHTHGDIEARENGLSSREQGIRKLIENVFSGSFKMVRRRDKNGEMVNTIWDSFSLALIEKDDVYEIIET